MSILKHTEWFLNVESKIDERISDMWCYVNDIWISDYLIIILTNKYLKHENKIYDSFYYIFRNILKLFSIVSKWEENKLIDMFYLVNAIGF